MAKLGDTWIFGRLDAIVHDGDDYYILDYKTGTIPKNPERDYQTMIYLLCADKIIRDKNSISFVYIDLKNNENKLIVFNEERKNIYEQLLHTKTSQIIATKEFEGLENRSSCKFCEYAKICG